MSVVPNYLKYTQSHEWVDLKEDGVAKVGITDHAQHLLGDLVFIELPEIGAEVSKGSDAGVLESVKAASELFSPLSGEVLDVNESLADAPEQINEQAFGTWIFTVKYTNSAEIEELLSPEEYSQQIAED